jgi:hypothetical protein
VSVKLLILGDVVGRPGRYVLSQALPRLVQERGVDFVIVNAENVAGGSGITPQLYEKIIRYGVDVITLGDHCYRRNEIFPILEQADNIIRPANLTPTSPGKGWTVRATKSGVKVAVCTVLGQLFVRPHADCFLRAVDQFLGTLPADVRIRVVEMHAEATSEKVAMGWYLDGRASVVFGTHTHIQTADERVLPKGTAYITDLGMTGPYNSVLGRRSDRVIRFLSTHVPNRFDVAEGDARACGVVVTVDEESGRATAIERVCVREDELPVAGQDS